VHVRWERGNRYGGVEDRRGMRSGGVAGGGIGLVAVALARIDLVAHDGGGH